MKAIPLSLAFVWAAAVALGAGTEFSIANGDFEEPDRAGRGPAFWQPLRQGYSWVDAGGKHGRILRFDLPEDVKQDQKFEFYGQKALISAGRIYRCSVDVRTDGPHVILYLNFYSSLGAEKERRVYRRHITSTSRVEPNGEWQKLEFTFMARQPAPMGNQVLNYRKSKDDQLKVEAQFIVFGAKGGGRVEVDNLRITLAKELPASQAGPTSREDATTTRSVQTASSAPTE